MRLRIDTPCFLDIEGPFTITPIYQSQKVIETAAASLVKASITSDIGLPEPAVRHINYPSTRRPYPKVRRTCVYCGRGFNGLKQQLYCSTQHKHLFYDNGKQPMEGVTIIGPTANHPRRKNGKSGLTIRAGATGVQVNTGHASGAGY